MQTDQKFPDMTNYRADRELRPAAHAPMRAAARWGQAPSIFLMLLTLMIFSSCTRNRPAPESVESTPVTTSEDGAVAVAPSVNDGNAQSNAEPQVSVETPANAEASSGAANEPAVSVDQQAVPLPEQAPVATATPAQPDAFAYTITAGDTVVGIAELFGIEPDVIREMNFLVSDNIQAGQILRIPRGANSAPAAETESTSAAYVHVVQPGDTLYAISVQYDTSAGDLIAANGLSSPDDIIVGQELTIPGYQPTEDELSATGEEGGTGSQVIHIVQPGDQLFAIAERYGVTSADLITANNIQNPGLMRIGQRLIIPGVTELQAAAATGRLHVVQPGEGLGQIAATYGVTIEEIARLNNLGNIEIIYPGQELIIPGN